VGGDEGVRSNGPVSVGVTYDYFLTGEHPYLEGGQGNRVVRQLRSEPLHKLIKRRGHRFAKLTAVIEGCLSLDPGLRYQAYRDTGLLAKQDPGARNPNIDFTARSAGIASRAALYFEKGEPERAERTLTAELNSIPNDLVLLNELARVKAKSGSRLQEAKILSECYALLSRTQGLFLGDLYLDPAIRWAGRLVEDGQFDEAKAVLETALTWDAASALGAEKVGAGKAAHRYGEFGWLYLYAGHFERAADYLQKFLVSRAFERLPVQWLVEASWLADSIGDQADFIARKLMSRKLDVVAKKGGPNAAWCLLPVLVQQFAS